MIRNRKETAWKKSRKFGDIKGGRKYNKYLNTVLNRFHDLEKPDVNDSIPIFIKDNPSRDYFFPIEISDIKEFLKNYRRHKQTRYHIFGFKNKVQKNIKARVVYRDVIFADVRYN